MPDELRRIGHRVAGITFGNKLAPSSTMECSCGWVLAAASPESLQLRWQEHRREVGAREAQPSDIIREKFHIRPDTPWR